MKFYIELSGRKHTVELSRDGARSLYTIDGREIQADAVEIVANTFSIVIDGLVFEARVEPAPAPGNLRVHVGGEEYALDVYDPRRWQHGGSAALQSQGRQQVLAPMPGKVVRVLAKSGDAIESGQGIIVVEAMKMQNEVRSPKAGKVERILVAAGQAVNAGEVIAYIA